MISIGLTMVPKRLGESVGVTKGQSRRLMSIEVEVEGDVLNAVEVGLPYARYGPPNPAEAGYK